MRPQPAQSSAPKDTVQPEAVRANLGPCCPSGNGSSPLGANTHQNTARPATNTLKVTRVGSNFGPCLWSCGCSAMESPLLALMHMGNPKCGHERPASYTCAVIRCPPLSFRGRRALNLCLANEEHIRAKSDAVSLLCVVLLVFVMAVSF